MSSLQELKIGNSGSRLPKSLPGYEVEAINVTFQSMVINQWMLISSNNKWWTRVGEQSKIELQ